MSSKLTYLLHGSSDKIPSGLPALHLAQGRYNLADVKHLNKEHMNFRLTLSAYVLMMMMMMFNLKSLACR